VEESGIKTVISRQICHFATLRKVFTALLIQIKMVQRYLITVNARDGCRLLRLVYSVFKMSAIVCSEACSLMVNGCVDCALLNAVPNVCLHN